jgi:hypothetical protein
MTRVHAPLKFIEPQLPSLVNQPPEGKHWIHEIKHDGYRSIVVIENGNARVFTRNGFDWTDRYPSIARPHLTFAANQRLLMVRPSSRTTTVPLIIPRRGNHYSGVHRPRLRPGIVSILVSFAAELIGRRKVSAIGLSPVLMAGA